MFFILLAKRIKKDHVSLAKSFLSRETNGPFLKKVFVIKNGSFMIISCTKSCKLKREETPRLTQRVDHHEGKLCYVYGGIIAVLFI